MPEQDIAKTTTPTGLSDFKIGSASTDGISGTETRYGNERWEEFYGKYKSSTKLKAVIKKWATWVVGLGLTEKSKTPVIENIRGSGEDTIISILWNMLIVKKINGDAYAEIIRSDEGTLINLKPLDPSGIVVVFNEQGVIDHYEQVTEKEKPNVNIPVEKMFHIVNDRVADETHGDSVVDSLIWNLEAQEEARRMYRKKVKNSGIIGIVKAATDNNGKLTAVKVPIKEGMEKGTFIIVPEDVLDVSEWAVKLNTQELIAWLNYLDDEFYQILGMPKVIGGASGDIEGDSKISYVTFEPDYRRAIGELQDDFWNQVAERLEFNLPTSLIPQVQSSEKANTSQTGFQPNDTQAGVGA